MHPVRPLPSPCLAAGRTPLHKPQLYFAMQVQCGVTFRDDVAYDFSIDAPFSLACLTPFKPVVTCMRRREMETSVLAESAEELFRQGQLDMSLQVCVGAQVCTCAPAAVDAGPLAHV